MTKKVLVIGSSGGIGKACCETLSKIPHYETTAWTSQDLDLDYPETIFDKDFSSFDILINCAGHSQGTYKGFINNTWQNQLSQINVNYVSNLFLLKHYAQSRSQGKYVWCSTTLSQGVTPYKSLYLSTKIGSQFAFDLIRQEVKNISILEAQFLAVKTNFRARNFESTLSPTEIELTYKDTKVLDAKTISEKIIQAMENDLEKVTIE